MGGKWILIGCNHPTTNAMGIANTNGRMTASGYAHHLGLFASFLDVRLVAGNQTISP